MRWIGRILLLIVIINFMNFSSISKNQERNGSTQKYDTTEAITINENGSTDKNNQDTIDSELVFNLLDKGLVFMIFTLTQVDNIIKNINTNRQNSGTESQNSSLVQ